VREAIARATDCVWAGAVQVGKQAPRRRAKLSAHASLKVVCFWLRARQPFAGRIEHRMQIGHRSTSLPCPDAHSVAVNASADYWSAASVQLVSDRIWCLLVSCPVRCASRIERPCTGLAARQAGSRKCSATSRFRRQYRLFLALLAPDLQIRSTQPLFCSAGMPAASLSCPCPTSP
jgi:hypothetical protein